MGKPIYLDYNATTPVDPEVANEMLPYLHTHFGNPSSSYVIGRNNKAAMNKARQQVAQLINATPEEIVFTSGGTESNNHAIRGIALANREKGRHIITSSIEHPAVIEVCKYLATLGYEITYLPVDANGKVDVRDVEKAIRPDTVLITIMHANNETGTIQPIEDIGKIARQKNIAFHTDAAQSAGKIETDVQKLHVDLLTIAGHKLYAPKGIGALYIRQGTQLENLMYGAGQENGMRPGTENLIHIVGLGKASEIARRDLNKNAYTMKSTKEKLLVGLRARLGGNIKVNGRMTATLPNTLSVSFDHTEAHALVSMIGHQVLISAGSACHADSIEISPVLKAMNMDITDAASTVRISTGKYTTMEEIDHAIEIISNIIVKLSKT